MIQAQTFVSAKIGMTSSGYSGLSFSHCFKKPDCHVLGIYWCPSWVETGASPFSTVQAG